MLYVVFTNCAVYLPRDAQQNMPISCQIIVLCIFYVFFFAAIMVLVMIPLANKVTRTLPTVTQATDSPSQPEDLRGQVQVKVKYLYAHNQGLFRVWLSNLLRFHEKNVNVIFIYFHSSIISSKKK